MAIRYWLKHPHLIVPRMKFWLWEKRHPDLPWMTPGTIAFCERHLKPSMRALEFGSGRSTHWFAKHVGHLTSVEHNRGWFDEVKGQIERAGLDNVDYRFVPLDHAESEPEPRDPAEFPAYVRVADEFADRSLDLVIVDGHYRTLCVRRALPRIAPGGYLLVDDMELWPSPDDLPVPSDWRVADRSSNGLKSCIIWQAP